MTPGTAVFGALWLGVLTSMSPCPLTTNIVAISFLARRAGHPRRVWLSGLAYTTGRMMTYVAVSSIVVAGLLSIPGLSFALQRYANAFLGPLLLLIGLFLLGRVKFPSRGSGFMDRLQARMPDNDRAGAGFLGMIFALSFCPVSAALFFGSLIPLAVSHKSRLLIPAAYGAGTGLPVAVSAVLLAFGTNAVARFFHAVTRVETWARRATGVLFLAGGAYYVYRWLSA